MTTTESPVAEAIEQTEKAAPAGERLQKVLARHGLGSRRQIESWIAEGRIEINGEKATLGMRLTGQETVTLDGRSIHLNTEATTRRVIAYNKPEGEVCTRTDPEGRPTVFDRMPKIAGERWIAIGRLDINTSGLLLFTNDGELANRLMHPSYQIEREYAVRVFGEVTEQKVKNLFEGVELEDGMARFTDIVDSGNEGINRWFHVCLLEGRNREVRRLWESQELAVSRLKRVRYGSTIIPDHLRQGRWEELEQADVDALADLVELPRVKAGPRTVEDKQKTLRSQRKKPQVRTGKKPGARRAEARDDRRDERAGRRSENRGERRNERRNERSAPRRSR
ncbi:23S rRNA pseudouridine(2605) synthase RluB [Parendozoicomonas haliclonae]|uniref:Pseudouridine synthase n=1 Tax=Parendozoicomonas haliclonae TaxID=1960125 RepID=A0A1X7AQE2_9GAMM|nr:23S rRNA pseudouridine(2605) synthase RluB [Parendozoicomonas haliclonae]SMA50516.1 Ribosomal large subunit pseudouridine synthase B [Parendozoicomonas haliclonae]